MESNFQRFAVLHVRAIVIDPYLPKPLVKWSFDENRMKEWSAWTYHFVSACVSSSQTSFWQLPRSRADNFESLIVFAM